MTTQRLKLRPFVRIAPRPLLLISAGRGTEARANEEYKDRGGRTSELWNLPGASHAAALRTDPATYERRVIGFLDRTLRERRSASEHPSPKRPLLCDAQSPLGTPGRHGGDTRREVLLTS